MIRCYLSVLAQRERSWRRVHSHGEGLLVFICEPGPHLQVTVAKVIRTTGLLDVDLIDEDI